MVHTRIFQRGLVFILLIIFGLSGTDLSAQNISVKSFRLLETDLTANTAGTMKRDQNNETAALIKVVTKETGFVFDGGMLGIVATMQKTGELTANGVPVEMGDGLWVTKGRPELIQGSSLTMHSAFTNLVHWGLPIETASAVTSTTPARIYSLSDRGEIAPGKRADLVVMDRSLGIRFTMVNGEIVCGTAN